MTDIFAIQTQTNQKIQWTSLSRNHADDIKTSTLIRIACDDKKDDQFFFIKYDDIVIDEINKFCKKNNLPQFLDNKEIMIDNNDDNDKKKKKNKNKKEKEKQLTSKEKLKLQIETNNKKKELEHIFNFLKIEDTHYPLNKTKPLDCFINMIYWTIYCIKNNSIINIEILFDVAISLNRMQLEYNQYFDEYINNSIISLLNNIHKIIKKMDKNYYLTLIDKYTSLINASYWDINKPNSIDLYDEQKELLDVVLDRIKTNTPLLLFYWVPPANGKTLICNILTKLISKYNHENEKNKGFQRKSILYICYNDIVRNSVSQLCTTHNVDIKFWFANYHRDMYEDYDIVDFRPYKNCFPDWRTKTPKGKNLRERDKKFEKNDFSPDVRTQWYEYLDKTRLLNDREKDLDKLLRIQDLSEREEARIKSFENASNTPEMVIADLASAEILLKEFPDLFIPYFDEAFAASTEMITARIMKVLPPISVLVSATLAYAEEIPTILGSFKNNHNLDNNDFIYYIKNDVQQINCDFINPEGNIITPHHLVSNVTELEKFTLQLNKYPIIQRGYSNKIVYEMYQKLKDILPDELLLKNKFAYLGSLTNKNLRNYGIELIHFISNSKNEEYFELIKEIEIKLIEDNSLENMITHNSYFYSTKNTLHVTNNSDNFLNYVTMLTKDLLEGSPKLKNLISDYEKETTLYNKKIESYEKSNKDDCNLEEINFCKENLSKLKIKYSEEFIWNSFTYLKKYKTCNKVKNYNKPLFNFDIISNLDDISAKLFMSHIGLYNQNNMTLYEMDVFLQYKDIFKFIMSDPSIIF